MGNTVSADFPVKNPLQAALAGKTDATVTRLTPDGAGLQFSTFLGGSANDSASSVALLAGGDILVAGSASSPDFPVRGAVQPSYAGGVSDGFVARIDPTAPALVFSTFLGGSGNEGVFSLDAGGDGTLYLGGVTTSPDFPVREPIQAALAGTADGFVTWLTGDGSRILRSTFFGGEADDALFSRLSSSGGLYFTGQTSSVAFPVVNAEQPLYGGGNDSFVVRTDCWIAALTSPDVTICPGTPVTLDGSASAGCPSGLTHRWLDGTTVLCTSPTCGVTPAATTTYTLEVGCSSCTGPCTDTAAVTVTVRLDTIPPDQGNVLLAVKQLLDVVLDFTGAPAATWRLYRDGDKLLLGTTALAPDAATTSFTDPGAIPPLTALWFYRVKGLSPCSLTPGP